METLSRERPLEPDEAVRPIYSCYHLADLDGALAALEHYRPPPGSPAHRQLQAFRTRLVQLETHLRLLGRR